MKSVNKKNGNVIAMFTAFLCLVAAPFAQGEMLDNAGDEFIISFLYNYNNGSPQTVELHLTSDTATTVDVEYPYDTPTFTASVGVVPGTITVVQLPIEAAQDWVANTVMNNTVHAYSEDEFICYLVNRRQYTSDAAMALPVDTMNTRYLVLDYFPVDVAGIKAEFVVYALEDNTTVTITPAQDIIGHAKDVPFDVVLDAGEGYYGESVNSGGFGSLTGTLITADKPVGLSNGTECSFVPTYNYACDHLFEVAQSVQTWGKYVLTANLPLHPQGCLYRVLASEDDTEVVINGGPALPIDAGEYIETSLWTGNHVFTADKPIYVMQYMTGQDVQGTGIGDPAMGNMIPAEQYLSSYTFSTVGGGQFAQHWLTVIAEDTDIFTGTILLDGLAIPPGSFSPVGTSGFSAAVLPLEEGTHTTSSDGVHGITVEGFNSYDSYLYPGGAQFEIINPIDITVEKVYRHTNVCFERDDDMDFLFNEDPVEVEIDNDGDGFFSEDPVDCVDNDGDTLVDEDPSEAIDNDGDTLVNEDDINCLDGTYMGDLLMHEETPEGDLIPNFYIEAVVHKKGWIQNYVPGQYYAASCVKLTSAQDYLKIVEWFSDCTVSGISELNPAPGQGGGSVVIVYVDDMDTADPADDVAYQIADANPDAGVVDFLYGCGDMLVGATATLTDVQPGTYCMYVKFGPGLKGEEVALPVSCSNMAYVYTDPEASIYDPEAAVAEATATLTVLEME